MVGVQAHSQSNAVVSEEPILLPGIGSGTKCPLLLDSKIKDIAKEDNARNHLNHKDEVPQLYLSPNPNAGPQILK